MHGMKESTEPRLRLKGHGLFRGAIWHPWPKRVDDARRPMPSGLVVAAQHCIPLAFALLFASFVMAAESRPPLRGGVEKSDRDRGQGEGYCERYGASINLFEGRLQVMPKAGQGNRDFCLAPRPNWTLLGEDRNHCCFFAPRDWVVKIPPLPGNVQKEQPPPDRRPSPPSPACRNNPLSYTCLYGHADVIPGPGPAPDHRPGPTPGLTPGPATSCVYYMDPRRIEEMLRTQPGVCQRYGPDQIICQAGGPQPSGRGLSREEWIQQAREVISKKLQELEQRLGPCPNTPAEIEVTLDRDGHGSAKVLRGFNNCFEERIANVIQDLRENCHSPFVHPPQDATKLVLSYPLGTTVPKNLPPPGGVGEDNLDWENWRKKSPKQPVNSLIRIHQDDTIPPISE